MQIKHKNIEVNFVQCKKVADIAIIVGIPFNCNKCCLNKLKCNKPSDIVYTGSESASIGYALYELIKEKLMGSALEMSKSKVSSMNCNSLNNHFLISCNTSAYSGLRKTMSIILSCLNPPKLYSKYAENMKLLGAKIDRDVFNSLSNEMTTGINKMIKFGVDGKLKADESKIKELLIKLDSKIIKPDTLKPTKNVKEHETHTNEYPIIKYKDSIAAIAIADYITNKSGGMAVEVCSDYIIIYNENAETKLKHMKDKGKINDYCKKYEKLKDDFYCVFAYMAITHNLVDCCTIGAIIKSKLKASEMSSLILKNM